jgi:4-hydroxybenzoate polyprenyltransferase
MVVALGVPAALRLAGWLHLLLLFFLLGFGVLAHQQKGYYLFLIPLPFLLLYEHRIAQTLRVDQINRAFFQTNVVVGFLFLMATCFGQ